MRTGLGLKSSNITAIDGVAPEEPTPIDDGEEKPPEQDAFEDDAGDVHEPSMNRLATMGVLDRTECGERRICPGEPLLRWVMAVWMIRILDEAPESSDALTRFADVEPGAWWTSLRGTSGRDRRDQRLQHRPVAILPRPAGHESADGQFPGPSPRPPSDCSSGIHRHRGQRAPGRHRHTGCARHHQGLRNRPAPLLPGPAGHESGDGYLPGPSPRSRLRLTPAWAPGDSGWERVRSPQRRQPKWEQASTRWVGCAGDQVLSGPIGRQIIRPDSGSVKVLAATPKTARIRSTVSTAEGAPSATIRPSSTTTTRSA